MKNKLVDSSLPNKYDTEDKIFSICDNEIEEFTEFLTNIKDIAELLPKRYLSQDFRDLNIDHAYLLKNGDVVHIEHHTNITEDLMRRNFQYQTVLHAATKKLVYPFIFNTGHIPEFKVDYASPTSVYNPTWINSKEKEQSVKLNNIKYKIQNNQVINAYDALDIIWMPTYRSNQNKENIIIELIEIYNNLIIDEDLLKILRKCLILWSGKHLTTEKNIKKAMRGLKMTKKEVEVTSQDIINARIDGMLCRAEEVGRKEGREEGRKEGREEGREENKLETARNMVNKGFATDDIVEITGLPRLSVLNIK
ncbi:MAG: hypothetical protein IJQ68_07935 [Methanobrevibacter sp.]|uniref:hypothetical protein n=1 Tax=Methanobrevibacter sp. TaxID=66852 RepID=UPI0025D9F9CB|nr:hypothetical protein [Methanobrevibacter sp.]MBR0271898.1 hypothetical protein [Methanobrevibacter sp.]